MLGKFSDLSFKDKVFVAVIAFGLIARLFALIVMPDTELTDSLYHLNITRQVIENRALPNANILEPPLFYFVTALPFILLPVPFTLATVRIFPFIFSALQLFLAFILLRRIFPKDYLPGFAFVAVHPLLIIFGSVNYLETFASVAVLLCFYIYWRFVESRQNIFLLTMPFAIAAGALSKITATVLMPAFFVVFLAELVKEKKGQRKKAIRILFFVAATALLCLLWFIPMFVEEGSVLAEQKDVQVLLSAYVVTHASVESVVTLAAKFNGAFWFFLGQGVEFMPFAISPEAVFFLFSIATGPVLILLFYGLVIGLLKKEKHSILLLLCFLLMVVLLAARGTKFIHSRFMVPMLPLFGIAAANAFRHLQKTNWRKLLLFLFCLTVIYSIAFSALYAMHFRQQYDSHAQFYEFAKGLPAGSVIAIHPNLTRQIGFITEKTPFAYKTRFDSMDAEQLYSELKKVGITHVAATCYKNPWNMQSINEMAANGKLRQIYGDECSNLYEVK